MKKWHIFFISWVSGAWKWTLTDNIKKQKLDNVVFPLSSRSRKPRAWEIPWVDSHFLTTEEFEKQIENWEFLEYAVYSWKYYWTKFEDVLDNGIDKWHIVIKELELQWLKKVEESKPELKKHTTTIFLDVDDETMKQRILSRDNSITEEDLDSRLKTAVTEREMSKMCDYKIDATMTEEEVLNAALKIILK